MGQLMRAEDQQQGKGKRNTVHEFTRPLRQEPPGSQERMEQIRVILVGPGPQRGKDGEKKQSDREMEAGKSGFLWLLDVRVAQIPNPLSERRVDDLINGVIRPSLTAIHLNSYGIA
jgi:hypothetical protein